MGTPLREKNQPQHMADKQQPAPEPAGARTPLPFSLKAGDEALLRERMAEFEETFAFVRATLPHAVAPGRPKFPAPCTLAEAFANASDENKKDEEKKGAKLDVRRVSLFLSPSPSLPLSLFFF